MSQFDQALVQAYCSFGSSVDRIAASSELRMHLRNLLPQEFQAVHEDEIVHRLLNLRKSGKLPRRNQTQGV